jgi:hypothetical protein
MTTTTRTDDVKLPLVSADAVRARTYGLPPPNPAPSAAGGMVSAKAVRERMMRGADKPAQSAAGMVSAEAARERMVENMLRRSRG